MSRYTLPALPYDYSALEPHISARIMELHHSKHHQAYVTTANETIEQLIEARSTGDFTQAGPLQKKLAFNVSGHILHSIFWQNMTPKGGGEPSGKLGDAVKRDFGSFESFKKQLNATASTIMGSGWAALVYDPVIKRLGTSQIHDHQSDVTQGGIPLMVIDAWEHAYYLQYQTEKAKFFDAVWNVWNWEDISRRFALAQQTDLGLKNAFEGA